MNTGIVSVRYARALLLYAKEQRVETDIYDNMLQLAAVADEVRELFVMLQSPALAFSQKVSLLCAAVDASPEFERFARLVIKQKREELLPYIARSYIALYRQDKNIVAAKFTTAVPLADTLRNKIIKIIADTRGATVEFYNAIDPTIIGGFVYEADSERLDASVKGRLNRIQKQIVEQNRKLV